MWSFQVMGAGSLKGENFEGWVCLKKWTRWVCGQGRQDGAVVLPSPPPTAPLLAEEQGRQGTKEGCVCLLLTWR